MSLRAYWVFSCEAPCQARFRHLPLGLKWDLKHFDFDVSFTCQDTSSLHQDPARCVCLVFVTLKFTELRCVAVICPGSSEDDSLQIRRNMFWPGYVYHTLLKIRLCCVLGQTLSQTLSIWCGLRLKRRPCRRHCKQYGSFLSHRGPNHPFWWDFPQQKPSSYGGTPMTRETPICLRNNGRCRLFNQGQAVAAAFPLLGHLW